MPDWRIVQVTHRSSEREKTEVAKFWDGNYLEMTRSRLAEPWDGESYGFSAAFLGEECIGTTSYTVSGRGQGIISQVHTEPLHRKKGIATATLEGALEAFRAHGARAVYLAAWSDWIRDMYRKAGFVRVGTMGERHAFKLTLSESGRDENLFRPGQRTFFRPMGKGDQADLTSLFNARHTVVVKHYDLGCFLGSYFEGEFYILQNQTVTGIVAEEKKEKKGFRAVVLDGEETVMGFGTVIPSSRRHEGHHGVLDLLVHPNYADREGELLARLTEGCELDHLTAYAETGEERKRHLLEQTGWSRIALLERHLFIEGRYYDLMMYRKD